MNHQCLILLANFGAFTKQLWKVSICFVKPSVCREESDYHWTDIHEISHSGLMLIFVNTLKFWLQSDKKTDAL